MGLPAAIVATVPPIVVVVLFSQVSPAAPAVLDFLEAVPPLLGLAAVAACLLFVVVLRWLGKGDDMGAWIVTLALAGASAFLCFCIFPFMVPGLLVLETAALLHALSRQADEEPWAWFSRARSALLVPAVGCLVFWIWFILSRVDHLEKWTDWTDEFRERVKDRDTPWKIAFVEWAVPLGISAELFFLALLYELQRRLADRHQEAVGQSGKEQLSVEDLYILSKVKLLGVLISIAVMVLWIGASLDAAGSEDLGAPREDMRNEVLNLSFWILAGLAAWLVCNLGGPDKVLKVANSSKVAERVLEFVKGEWACACYLLCFWPFLLIYAALIPICRSSAVPMHQEPAEDDGSSRVVQVRLQFYGNAFMSYLWTTPVVTKAQLLALGYASCTVGVKVISLMLAYTNALLSSLDVYVVSAAIFLIGTFLFLLPPTPGPPVYGLVGILVTASAQNSGWPTGWAMAWAVGVGFAIKMVFAAVAQKFIGEPMAKSVTIRNLVQMHTAEIRAIAMILQEDGITAAKVSILIGGPDWPVAVLCGMLRLRLCPIMLGLCPVLVQSVIPCVISGSLLIVFGQDDSKKALGETALALAGGLQLVALLVAGYYIQDTLESHYDELSAIRPEDREAVELEEEAAEAGRHFQEATEFQKLPCWVRMLLVLGLSCGILSCVLLAGPWKAITGHRAFKKVEVTSDIDEVIGGSPLSIVRPLGWIAIAFSVVDAICLQIFYCWAGTKTHKAGGYGAIHRDGSSREAELGQHAGR